MVTDWIQCYDGDGVEPRDPIPRWAITWHKEPGQPPDSRFMRVRRDGFLILEMMAPNSESWGKPGISGIRQDIYPYTYQLLTDRLRDLHLFPGQVEQTFGDHERLAFDAAFELFVKLPFP